MSPILFNIVADMLSILIKRAKDDGQINGVIPQLVDCQFCNMQMTQLYLWIMTWSKQRI
jgi:hypothetical protein